MDEHRLLETQIQAINRFPDQNPNPVLRVALDARMTYANASSAPVRRALGAEVGDSVAPELFDRLLKAATSGAAIEVRDGLRVYSLLPVLVEDLGFINLYGTDVTAEKVVERFPNQNPNPVLRMTADGTLIYANTASRPIVDALGLSIGSILPAELLAQLRESLVADARAPVEVNAGGLIFELLAVPVPEFSFINLYGTDVTAAREVAQAKQETERLLLNILPPPIAARLRAGEELIADRFEDASLLIADMVGFTELSAHMSADELVRLLNDIFRRLDGVVERHGLEKVKTIGDAYMVVGGVPTASDDHLARMAHFALDMGAEVDALQRALPRGVSFRVGINQGPVVAGVVGATRTIYDVWGDTVNIASRMEALGQGGRIHVTHVVEARLRDQFAFEPRGVIEVKGKGHMPTYFLLGRR